MRTSGGRASFSVLLFQDVAVIPILALLPLLATFPPGDTSHAIHSAVEHLPAWQAAIWLAIALPPIFFLFRGAHDKSGKRREK